jgi:hypothetical protein
MTKLSFSVQIANWTHRVKEAEEALFKECAQELAKQLDNQLDAMIYETPESPNYKRTRFLQASLMASKGDMPVLNRANPGTTVTPDFGQIEFVISDAELGETIFLGYTAEYGAYVHYGAENMAPRPWVTLVAQRWQQIVSAKAAEVKARFDL